MPCTPRVALVRRPGPRLAEGIVTHIDRTPVDVDLARAQWQGYVDALTAAGWRVVEVEPADDHPDAVFVEDPVVVHGDLAVICRAGAPDARGEAAGVERAVRTWGCGWRTSRRPERSTAVTCCGPGDRLRRAWVDAATVSASSSSRRTCASSVSASRRCRWSGRCT